MFIYISFFDYSLHIVMHLMSQGSIPRTCFFYFSIPQKVLPSWFFHHSIGDTTICCYLPPNLHDDKTWLGLELYVVFERRQSGYPTMLGVELYVHAGSNKLQVLKLDVKIADFVLGSQLFLFNIPGWIFPDQLNQSTGISVLFRPTTPDVEVEYCGTGLLYEKVSKGFAKAITNIASLGCPKTISSLHDHAKILLQEMEACSSNTDIDERNGVNRDKSEFGCFSSFQR